MHRRHFAFRSLPATLGLLAGPRLLRAAAARRHRELRITRIVVQNARGRRLTPVAPNAYAPYRGYDVSEPVLRIQTAQGLEGFCHRRGTPEQLQRLLGLDPFALFEWDGDVVRGPAEAHRELLADLTGADIALFDLLGRALRRPVADLLGRRVRREVPVYDSSLYIDQGDMNQAGYLRLQETARDCARRGMTMAPHNFGSKLGFYAMVHLGLVTKNWEFCESDDTQIPALDAPGFSIRKGLVKLTGEPGVGWRLREEQLEKASVDFRF